MLINANRLVEGKAILFSSYFLFITNLALRDLGTPCSGLLSSGRCRHIGNIKITTSKARNAECWDRSVAGLLGRLMLGVKESL